MTVISCANYYVVYKHKIILNSICDKLNKQAYIREILKYTFIHALYSPVIERYCKSLI